MGGMIFLRRVELWKNGRNGQSGQMGEMGASRAHFEEFTEVVLLHAVLEEKIKENINHTRKCQKVNEALIFSTY